MPDELFANQRLAPIYDAFEGDRSDLEHYADLIAELGATGIVDVGCGTGSLLTLLAGRGYSGLIGVDPAAASLEVAKGKPGAERITWLLGHAEDLPAMAGDLAIMTGNVGQVFNSDEEWRSTLAAIARTVGAGGHLVFEVRDPAKQAWLGWNRENTYSRQILDGVGPVANWIELTDVALPFVTFDGVYHFESDNTVMRSTSTLRFRERDEIQESLAAAGFTVDEVRDAPDRPGLEWVFVARRTEGT